MTLIFALVGFVVAIGILALVAYLLSENYKAIPAQYRKMEPNKVWLILIPLFNLYWIFPTFLGLSDSFKAAFDAKGVMDVGDCGRQLGLFYCICAVCGVIPCVGIFTGLASIVLLIMYLIKTNDLKKRLLIPPPAGM